MASTAAVVAEDLGKGQDHQHLWGWIDEIDDGDDDGVELSF